MGEDLTETVETIFPRTETAIPCLQTKEVNFTLTPSLEERWEIIIIIIIPGCHSQADFLNTQNSWEIKWFLLYQVSRNIRDNSVSKICELVTNLKTKHLGLIGCEGKYYHLWTANTLIQKSVLELETNPDFYWNNHTVTEHSILCSKMWNYLWWCFPITWMGLHPSHLLYIRKDAVETSSWTKCKPNLWLLGL